MTPDIVVIVRVADAVQRLQTTINSVRRSTLPPSSVLIVVDDTTPSAALAWVESLGRDADVTVVRASGSHPGAVRNAGLRASSEALVVCIDAGDRFDHRYLETARLAFDGDDGLAWVTTWVVSVETEGVAVRRVESVEPSVLAGDPDAVHASSMFRRSLSEEIGPFDESLPVLDHYDFWLRAIGRGHPGRALSLPLVRLNRDHSLHWRSWTHPDRPEVIRQLVERHRDLFEDHFVEALHAFEREMWRSSARYHERVRRHDVLAEELHELDRHRDLLREQCAPEQHDTFDLGDLRRTSPVSTNWGYERGTPIDRWYIEAFLAEHQDDVRGIVLEVQESDYTRRFGGDRVTAADVVDLSTANTNATVITDLRNARNVPSDRYDCIILTQTLHVVDDMRAVVGECFRILRPGGVLLATLPCVSRVCLEYGWEGDFWRLTEAGVRTLFSDVFAPLDIEVRSFGNVLVNAAFQYGLACHEISDAEFRVYDPYNPLLVGVRACKRQIQPAIVPRSGSDRSNARGSRLGPSAVGAVLLYHRVAEPRPDVHGLAVPVETFRQQMEHLARSWHVLPLDEFVEANAHGRLPDRALAITFDDGYLDNLTVAAPVLVRLGLPATFFLTTQGLRGRLEYWWDTLERVLLVGRDLPSTLEWSLDGERVLLDTATREQRLAAHARVHRGLVEAGLAGRDAAIRDLVEWAGTSVPASDVHILNGARVEDLAQLPGCGIGAHTVHHLGLPALPTAIVERELSECREELEPLVRRPVTMLAYPYGYWSEETVACARRTGFAAAFTCDERAVAAADDPLVLPRLEVKAWSASELERRLTARLSTSPVS